MASSVTQFTSPQGDATGPVMDLPLGSTPKQLNHLINQILNQEEEPLPYAFFIGDTEILTTVADIVKETKISTENVLIIKYQPQAMFRVRAVTRCSASIPGHAEAILNVSFSPDARNLATASGDTTIRLWNLSSQTPEKTLKGHQNWVLVCSWSPDGKKLASGGMDSLVCIWDPQKGDLLIKKLKGHTKWITFLSWEPMHKNSGKCCRIASASKDASIRIWDTSTATCQRILSAHTASVTCVKWGGEGFLYSSSQDRTIKVWDPDTGAVVRSLDGHGHWVNTMALSTDYILRTGGFDYKCEALPQDLQQACEIANQRYSSAKQAKIPDFTTTTSTEKLVSGSDDYTLHLWDPTKSNKPIARMTGHQQLVNSVKFSPDQLYIASGSFDKSVKLWNGITGNFITSFRGHVGAIYEVCWSPDSRLLLSSSKDSTIKVWELRTKKLKEDLPGHADEVYSVDWSPDGAKVASGGKDRMLKLWHH